MTPFELTSIPEVLKDCTLEAVPECAHKGIISKYIEKLPQILTTRQGLYLWGDYGQGKSALAAIILKEALKLQKIGFWVTAKEYPGHVINQVEWMDGILVTQRCLQVPILVIDELQIRQEVKFQETCIEDLVRARISLNKPTILTSNIVPSVVQGLFPAFFSVLQECFASIHVKGYDWRAANKGLVTNFV